MVVSFKLMGFWCITTGSPSCRLVARFTVNVWSFTANFENHLIIILQTIKVVLLVYCAVLWNCVRFGAIPIDCERVFKNPLSYPKIREGMIDAKQ